MTKDEIARINNDAKLTLANMQARLAKGELGTALVPISINGVITYTRNVLSLIKHIRQSEK